MESEYFISQRTSAILYSDEAAHGASLISKVGQHTVCGTIELQWIFTV